ncbi:MAG TPA: 2-dehydropantoate 2-reductase N-terminal domain-containing protein, partial [Kofleriaceae bacterium]
MNDPLKIAVFGAGAIGCWVGGRLRAGGAEVWLIGRPRVLSELREGLSVTETGGKAWTVRPDLSTEPEAAKDADFVLVTVKSAQTADVAKELVGAKGVIISLQNGVHNAD